jgi:hypothetical protein
MKTNSWIRARGYEPQGVQIPQIPPANKGRNLGGGLRKTIMIGLAEAKL